MPNLSKPLVVPQFGNWNAAEYLESAPFTVGLAPYSVNLFAPLGANPPDLFAIDLSQIFSYLEIDPTQYLPSANACVAVGADLYVSISGLPVTVANPTPPPPTTTLDAAAAVLKFAGYFAGNNTTATVIANDSVTKFTQISNSYCGLAFDGAGNLYTVENGSEIYAYPIANGGLERNTIYNGNSQTYASYFGDLAFDASGNLWVADYNNNSILAFPHATLGGTNAYTIVTGSNGPFQVINTGTGLTGTTSYLFTSPEGVGFDSSGNLWVGNNNDGYEPGGANNTLTSLVQITPGLLGTIVGKASTTGGTVSLGPSQALTTLAQVQSPTPPAGYAIYQVPTPTADWKSPQFGGLQIDMIGATELAAGQPQYLYVNDEIGSAVQQYDINPNSPGFLASIASGTASALTLNDASNNSVVTNPGNGGIALVYASLLIADDPTDTGAEPDSTLPDDDEGNPIFWESNSIGVGTSATPPANFSQDATIGYTSDAYVYVNVQNIGSTATTGTEHLRVYWASGAISQSWPAPWDGSEGGSTGGEITTPPGVPLPVIEPGGAWAASIAWPDMPNPATNDENTHWCLLARIETQPVYPFGMTYWEKNQATDPGDPLLLSYNVTSNSKIAQRNIYIGTPGGGGIGGFGIHPFGFKPVIWAANFGPKIAPIRIGFQLLNEAARTIGFAESHLAIRAEGSILDRLLARKPDSVEYRGDGKFQVFEPEKGIGGIVLQPGEKLPVTIEFTPPHSVRGYALRVMQYDETDGARRLTGGQTFVFGKVTGFTSR